jgi:hypothetical protein
MAEPIAASHADHANFARLLNLLERQLITFHAGEQVDYALLLDSALALTGRAPFFGSFDQYGNESL